MSKKNKYLFLDIDGVLNHEEWYTKIHEHPELCPGPFPYECFDPDCVRRVNEILEKTGVKLIISSSWRLDNELTKTFVKVGLPKEFLITPYLYSYGTTDSYDYSSFTHPCRGDEIKAFLDKHPCNTYAIVDDDSDMLEEQLEHFVQTAALIVDKNYKENEGTGLTETIKNKIIRILSK